MIGMEWPSLSRTVLFSFKAATSKGIAWGAFGDAQVVSCSVMCVVADFFLRHLLRRTIAPTVPVLFETAECALARNEWAQSKSVARVRVKECGGASRYRHLGYK